MEDVAIHGSGGNDVYKVVPNYEFYTANNIIPRGLLPHCLPAFDSNNFWFHRQWKNICFITARRHLTLLTKECRLKIKLIHKELSNCKKLLKGHCTPETFSFYISRINSMALSLESLLARRRAKKTNISHATNSNVTVSDNLYTFLNNNTQASPHVHVIAVNANHVTLAQPSDLTQPLS